MRKVTYARFHQELYIPNAGSLGITLPAQSKTLENLEMSSSTEGANLVVKFLYRGIKNELLIPAANVVLMLLTPEETFTIKAVETKKSA